MEIKTILDLEQYKKLEKYLQDEENRTGHHNKQIYQNLGRNGVKSGLLEANVCQYIPEGNIKLEVSVFVNQRGNTLSQEGLHELVDLLYHPKTDKR